MTESAKAGVNQPSALRELLASLGFVIRASHETGKLIVPMFFLNQFAQVLIPFISIFLPKMIIDALTAPTFDLDALLSSLGIVGICLLVVNVIGAFAQHYCQSSGTMVGTTAGTLSVLAKTLHMDYQTMEAPRAQAAYQKAMAAIFAPTSGMKASVSDLAAFCAHICALGLYALITVQLSPVIILALAVASTLSYLAVRAAQRYEALHRGDVATVYRKIGYMRDTALDYRGGKDLRLYAMTDWFERLYTGYIEEYLMIAQRFFRRHFAAEGLATVLDLVRDSLAYIWLITLVIHQEISIGEFTLFFGAIAGISNWITMIMTDVANLQRGCNEISDLRAYLDIPGRIIDNPLHIRPEDISRPEIVFDKVSFRYPAAENWTLRDFNLRIKPGEKMALVGVNGAGKTTLVKLLCGLYQPTEGRILLDGVDISRYPATVLFKLFGVVFQDIIPLAMSLEQNVAAREPGKIDRERVMNCLELAGLSAKAEEFPAGLDTQLTRTRFEDGIELSGGQAQKMMLARALYKDAPIVVMDEPTAALDPIAEAEMYAKYDQMTGAKTSLYISHRLASTRFCDRIAFLEGGMLLELGSHAELITLGGKYAEMYAVQSQYYQEGFRNEER